MEERIMFKVLVAGGPCERWIKQCIDSILEQKRVDFEVLVSLDNYDNAQTIVEKYSDERIKMLLNDDRMGGLYNIVRASKLSHIDDADILVFMDGDDWLIGTDALYTVWSVYNQHPETLVTHGGWKSNMSVEYDNTETLWAYTEEEFKHLRSVRWRGTQLKTMRYRVFKHINPEDFKDANGDWLFRAGDHALMFPALEMAGYHRTKCVKEKIYLYNRKDRIVTPEGQVCPEADVAYIRSKPAYRLLS